jgi:histidinol-phosphatase
VTAPDDWIPFLSEIADQADALALRHFRQARLQVELKPDASPVSEADRAIESAARSLVLQRHSGMGIWGEEEGQTGPEDLRLILDPIDGTRNFIRGIPVFATLLAIEQEGEVVAGLVSAPALHRRWHAARGAGAWSGSERLRVSAIDQWALAQVFHGSLGGSEARTMPPGMDRLLGGAGRTRGFGDFWQHLLVAEGAGEVSVDVMVSPWDIAPLLVIVEEAGGRATALDGERSHYRNSLVCTNGRLHGQALRLLTGGIQEAGGGSPDRRT